MKRARHVTLRLVAMHLRQAVVEIDGVVASRPVAMSVCPYIGCTLLPPACEMFRYCDELLVSFVTVAYLRFGVFFV